MSTLNHEAKVEYFITKWKTNKLGGISKISESPSFKIDGHFKPHKTGVMELELSDDGSLVYIVQNHDHLDLKMNIWDIETLAQVDIPNLQKNLDKLEKYDVKSLDLVQNNNFLLVLFHS